MRKAQLISLMMALGLVGCVDAPSDRALTGSDGERARRGFNDALTSARLVELDVGALADGLAPGRQFTLALPGPGPVDLVVDRVQTLVPGVTTLTGHLADDELADFTLSIEAGKLTGAIRQGTQAYLVEPDPGSHRTLVRTIDRTRIPRDEPSTAAMDALARTRASTTGAIGADAIGPATVALANGNVRVLFLYATDVGSPGSLAASIVGEFNTSLGASGIAGNNYLTVAGVQPVASNFAGMNRGAILDAMHFRSPPFTDLDTTMNIAAADIAFLLVSEDATVADVAGFGRVGGIAYVFDAGNPFGLSTQSYALGDRTALHEIGHIFGGRHENGPGSARPVVAPDRSWMTVMGGYIDCQFTGLPAACVRLGRWSNPDQTYLGVPLGVAGQRDMRTHLDGSMPAASNWRGDITPATMTSPAPGTTFASSTVTFTWTTGIGVSNYYLFVGNAPGAADYYAASQGLATTGTVANLPTDGRTLWVRLWSLTENGWQFNDYSYTATSQASPAVMVSPAPGSQLPGASVTFSWTAGVGVSMYYLFVGNSPGAADLYAAGQGLATSGTVSGLPTDGRTLYVRLWSYINGTWQYRDYAYTAAVIATPAAITSPTPGTQLPGASVTFAWNTGVGVSQYWLYVGTWPGGYDLYNASQGSATAASVFNLPTDGRPLYVRLWSYTNVGWQYRDYNYTAAVSCSPLNGTHGQLWTTVGANSLYVFRDGWCTVGHGLPEQCYEGTYYYYQTLQGSSCSSVGSSGTCFDDDAWYWVTCNALVDCIYNCSGQCIQASC